MKLFGNGGSRSNNRKEPVAAEQERTPRTRSEQAEINKAISNYQRKKKKRKRILIIVGVVLLAICAAGYAYIKLSVKPPSVSTVRRPGATVNPADPNATVPAAEDRATGKYTFLILGTDEVADNTDTIMVATFDADKHSLNVVSIPRDTLCNVSWNPKKANSIYQVSKDMNSCIDHFGDLLGYNVDHYFIVNLNAFQAIVDAVGGIDYNVPVNMDYDDPYQDPPLSIHLKKGMQHLTGSQAIGVMRFRHTYVEGDIQRVRVQQDFLKAAASQILAKKSSISIPSMIDILIKSKVKTDLDSGSLLWLAQQFLKIDSKNVNFYMLPGNYGDSVNGESYVTIYVDQWLKMINDYLNPFSSPITAKELSILTRNSGGSLYSTSGTTAGSSSWGSGSSSESDSTPEPTKKPSATESPKPSASPSPSSSAKPSGSPSHSASPSPSGTNSPKPSDSPAPTATPAATATPAPTAPPAATPATSKAP